MLEPIPVPAGSKWGAMVARRLNAFSPVAPAGSLVRSGPTGTGFATPPANLRDRKPTTTSQYWILTYTYDESSEQYTATWKNCVVQVGTDVRKDIWGEIAGTTIEDAPTDAVWYLEVNAETKVCEIKFVAASTPGHPRKSAVPPNDYENNIVNIYLGDSYVEEDGGEEDGGEEDAPTIVCRTINAVPVVYTYL